MKAWPKSEVTDRECSAVAADIDWALPVQCIVCRTQCLSYEQVGFVRRNVLRCIRKDAAPGPGMPPGGLVAKVLPGMPGCCP